MYHYYKMDQHQRAIDQVSDALGGLIRRDPNLSHSGCTRLGEGSQAIVYHACPGYDKFVIKQYHQNYNLYPEDENPALKECRVLTILSDLYNYYIKGIHLPKVPYCHKISDDSLLMTKMNGVTFEQLCNFGSVFRYMNEPTTPFVNMTQRHSEVLESDPDAITLIAYGIIQLLDQFHQRGIVHNDTSPENVLVYPLNAEALHVSIIDFGAAEPMTTESRQFEMSGLTDLFDSIGVDWSKLAQLISNHPEAYQYRNRIDIQPLVMPWVICEEMHPRGQHIIHGIYDHIPSSSRIRPIGQCRTSYHI